MESKKLNRKILFQHVQFYIDQNYESADAFNFFNFLGGLGIGGILGGGRYSYGSSHSTEILLESFLKLTEKTFSEMLLSIIERQGKKISDIYNKAGITKQHFSKIKNNPEYQPSKNTALALAVALNLNLEETEDLIGRAGFALSASSKSDLIVKYFIKEKIYDVDEINYNLDVRGFDTLTNSRNEKK